jgi:predicted DCC family thiol-disulfide oxidoreductase YuxK
MSTDVEAARPSLSWPFIRWPAFGSLSRVVFREAPTTPLELVRIGIGLALLVNYGRATQYLYTFWGDTGWLPRDLLFKDVTDPWAQSALFYLNAPWQLAVFHAVFLFCCVALMVGWRTRWVKWFVLIGHISYDQRNLDIVYGVNAMLACLLLILCFAPIGRALSLDRAREVRRAKRHDLTATVPPFTSQWAFACTRLMQLQMVVLFFMSAVHKLRGEDWWDGDALWHVFAVFNYYNGVLLEIFSRHYWLVNVATWTTILIEIAYPFLIWQRATRPYLLALAIYLHLMFAGLLNLYYFSFVMIMGHLSFVRPEWLHDLGHWWKQKVGRMEMIYDGNCGFCKRSMAWFLAFDGLKQIEIRNYRTDPSPVVQDELVDKALYLVLPDGRALPGFEAYRYVVARVPGQWWMVPFFYIPVLSRLIGTPLYNRIAANRSRLSKYV